MKSANEPMITSPVVPTTQENVVASPNTGGIVKPPSAIKPALMVPRIFMLAEGIPVPMQEANGQSPAGSLRYTVMHKLGFWLDVDDAKRVASTRSLHVLEIPHNIIQ